MKFKIALCQMQVCEDKRDNLQRAGQLVREAAAHGAQLVCLPEMFCCPYDTACFSDYAEPIDGEIAAELSSMARGCGCLLVGGSFPEREGDRLYNTCPVFGRRGELLGRHRKLHLFDVDISGGVRFRESDLLSPGDRCTLVDTEFGTLGVAICFDVRFVELFRIMADGGASLVLLPAAFNPTTGPAHWELTLRARALDNQFFLAACAPALNPAASYHSHGHSLVADPWGRVIGELGEGPGILYAEVDTDFTERIRRELPILSARRTDLYTCALRSDRQAGE